MSTTDGPNLSTGATTATNALPNAANGASLPFSTELIRSATPAAREQVVLVTGAASGIGFETSIAYAEKGCIVFGTVRNHDASRALEVAADERGVHINVKQLDVDTDYSVSTCIEAILTEVGHIDVLVNNAGTGGRGSIELIADQLVRGMFETNVYGVLRTIRAVLPGMRAQRSGLIVNVSSIAGLVPVPFNGIYSATKHAVEAISEALSFELAPFGIAVAIIEPGHYRTNMGKRILEHTAQDSSSPYASAELRSLDLVRRAWKEGADPREVGEFIASLSSAGDRLRSPVGVDAHFLSTARRALDEAQWGNLVREKMLDDVSVDGGPEIK